MLLPVGLRRGPAFVSAVVEPLISGCVVDFAVKFVVLPQCPGCIADKAELHDTSDGWNEDGFDNAVGQEIALGPATINDPRNRRCRIGWCLS